MDSTSAGHCVFCHESSHAYALIGGVRDVVIILGVAIGIIYLLRFNAL